MNTVQFNENNLAVNSGMVRVYDCHPQTSEYLGVSDEFLMAGVGLPANSYLDQPPAAKEGFAICRVDGQWQYVVDYRGQTVYNKQTAQSETMAELGELADSVTLIEPATAFDYWDGEGWRTNVEKQTQQAVAAAQAEKQHLLELVEKELAILQRAAKLELATNEELKRLIQCERYTVLLSRVDTSKAPDIQWPTAI